MAKKRKPRAEHPPRELNALQYVEAGLEVAEAYSFAANQHLQMLRGAPRPQVEVGKFYVTFDGSIVQAIAKIPAGNCPCCGEAHPEGLSINGAIGQILTMAQRQMSQQVEEGEPGDDDADEPDDGPADAGKADKTPHDHGFVCCIVRGGHGFGDLYGTGPGERYGVDGQGLSYIQNCDRAGHGTIIKAHLYMVGLSLARQVEASFDKPKELAADVPTPAATTVVAEQPQRQQQHADDPSPVVAANDGSGLVAPQGRRPDHPQRPKPHTDHVL